MATPNPGPLRLVGADADDLAEVLGPEDRRHRTDAVESAGDVGVQHLGPGLLAQPPERAVVGDAGIVDQEVDPAQLLLGLVDELLHRLPVADVAAPGVHPDAHGRQRGLGQQRLLADVAARHVHEAERHVAAEPAELHGDVRGRARWLRR